MKQLVFLLLILLPAALGAGEVSRYFTPQEMRLTKGGKILTNVYLKHSPRLSTTGESGTGSPVIPQGKYTTKAWMTNELVVVEKAYLPVRISQGRLISVLTRYSRLRGMKYFSKSSRSAETLIKDAYRTSRKGDSGRLKDPTWQVLPDSYSTMFIMEDNRFGKLLYKSSLYRKKNILVLRNSTAVPLKKFGFTIADPGRYIVITILIQDDHGWFLYSLTTSQVKSDIFLKLKLVSPKSFGNRIRATTVHLANALGLSWKDKLAAFR